MKPNFYYEVPDNYEVVKVIDAKNVKTMLLMNFVAILIAISLITLFVKIVFRSILNENLVLSEITPYYFSFLIILILYLIMHELTHGIFYKIFTHEKLTFGLTLTVAYCGVPKIYVKRIPALITTLAPFVVFSIVLGVPLFFEIKPLIFLLISLLFSIHVSGCTGDLWVALILIFKYRGRKLLVNDTGPKQTFYAEKQI
jgi:hypothetical protein